MSFLLQWLFFSNIAKACGACGFGNDGSRWGFLVTTALMTAVPLVFIGGTLWYLKKNRKLKMKLNKKSILINLIFICAIAGAYIFIKSIEKQSPYKMAPAFELPLLSQEGPQKGTKSLKEHLGKPVLLSFWASWCTACAKEKPYLKYLYTNYGHSSVQMIGIVSNDTLRDVQNSGKLKSIEYPALLDESGDVAQALGISALPSTVLVDGAGRIRMKVHGTLDSKSTQDIEDQIALLEKNSTVLKLSETQTEKPRGKKDPPPVFSLAPDFELPSSLNTPFGLKDLKGKLWVADFIFTSCTTACPILTQKMKSLQESTPSGVHLVSISVDPKNDTPAALKKYAEKTKADPKRWHFLTGKWNNIRSILSQGFKLGIPDKPIFHTDRFVLVDQKGQIRGYYASSDKEKMEQLERDIKYLYRP